LSGRLDIESELNPSSGENPLSIDFGLFFLSFILNLKWSIANVHVIRGAFELQLL